MLLIIFTVVQSKNLSQIVYAMNLRVKVNRLAYLGKVNEEKILYDLRRRKMIISLFTILNNY